MLFESLKEYNYNKKTFEIQFENSKIILNIRDTIRNLEDIEVKNQRKLFRYYKRDLYTIILYSNNKNLTQIGPDKIGRVIGILVKRKKCIENIYSLRLQFGAGVERLQAQTLLRNWSPTPIRGNAQI